MRLTIIGAGAIGGTIGAHMIRSGHEVLFCDQDEDHVRAINERGITIEGPVASFTVPARAVTPEGLPERIERAAIAVKSHHTEAAAEPLRLRLAPDGYLVSFQNGLTAPRLAQVVGWERLIVSLVNFGADYQAPGRILQGNVGTFRVGEPGGGDSERVRELCRALPYAEPSDNVMGYIWAKEAYGAMLYAGAVSDLSIADSLGDARFRPLMLALAREVLAQSPVRPEAFDGFDPADLEGSLTRLVEFNRGSAKSHSGIYRDLMVRHRKTEVDDLVRDLRGPLTGYCGEIIRAIERGERTCEVANLELLATLERTERLGRPLHAVVHLVPAPRRASRGPLHGLQVAVKDLIDVEGLPRGNGNPEDMLGAPATRDAPVVARLRQLGADVYATSALLEYAAGALHPEVPETGNPYAPERTAGGSSGGSAALVGVGACRLALGTDTGGSIRIPAGYCGVVGLKPTFGTLDLTGVQPLSPSLDHLGLIGRDVATVALGLSSLLGHPPAPAPERVRLGLLRGDLRDPTLEPEVASALALAVERLRGAGWETSELDPGARAEMAQLFDDVLLFELWQVHGARAESQPSHFGAETLRLIRSAAGASPEAHRRALQRRDQLLPQVERCYQEVDLLLTPVVGICAPRTTPPMDTAEGEAEGRFTSVLNLTGEPAVTLQCGWSRDGLPIGLQLVAPRGRDAELLAAAAQAESVLAVEPREPRVA